MMSKAEWFIFCLLIMCLPLQTRVIVQQWGGQFNEWSSAFLYLSDILAIFLILLWIMRLRSINFIGSKNFISLRLAAYFFIIFCALSIVFYASNVRLGAYQIAKLLEFIVFFFYLKYNFTFSSKKKAVWQIFCWAMIFSGLLQSLIAFNQFYLQSDLGLRYLESGPLGADINGVAKIDIDGDLKMIRSYGTFPHSNVLAVFLLAVIFCLYEIFLKDECRTKVKICGKKIDLKFLFLAACYFLLVLALFSTFSRSVIMVFVVGSAIFLTWEYFRRESDKVAYLALIVFLVSVVMASLFWPEIFLSFSDLNRGGAFSLRSLYNEIAFSFIHNSPILGVGYGNFVWYQAQLLDLMAPWIWQPVHNVYLLIAAEAGLLGMMAFLYFIFLIMRDAYRKRSRPFLIMISGLLLVLMLFDHGLWTLQQGSLLFWLILGML